MTASAVPAELLAGCPVAADVGGTAAAATQPGGSAKLLATLVAAAARGAARAGGNPAVAEFDASVGGAGSLLEDTEKMPLVVGQAAGRSGKLGVSEAKALLRDRRPSGALLAVRLGRLSKPRIVASHPDVGLAQDSRGVFGAAIGSDGEGGFSTEVGGAPRSRSAKEMVPQRAQVAAEGVQPLAEPLAVALAPGARHAIDFVGAGSDATVKIEGGLVGSLVGSDGGGYAHSRSCPSEAKEASSLAERADSSMGEASPQRVSSDLDGARLQAPPVGREWGGADLRGCDWHEPAASHVWGIMAPDAVAVEAWKSRLQRSAGAETAADLTHRARAVLASVADWAANSENQARCVVKTVYVHLVT
ncbi:unnamed protein product [Prorocentrum cordatum]|uniref:Uncharacterized protein n=1 Tax=Prorocentrum cordatum TaxID=2364126 RepID=A0ABN9XGT4_9DINO|nr:unnamed protein product [Polarella glacialis]